MRGAPTVLRLQHVALPFPGTDGRPIARATSMAKRWAWASCQPPKFWLVLIVVATPGTGVIYTLAAGRG